MPSQRRPGSSSKRARSDNGIARQIHVYDSFKEADDADRRYWWSRTPAQRMAALERLREINYGYGQGKPRPKFQRVLRVAQLRRR